MTEGETRLLRYWWSTEEFRAGMARIESRLPYEQRLLNHQVHWDNTRRLEAGIGQVTEGSARPGYAAEGEPSQDREGQPRRSDHQAQEGLTTFSR